MKNSNIPVLSVRRVKNLLEKIRDTKIVVVGDVMLDQYIWGHVSRISPEAPVPVVEFVRESYMPGGAANVARNTAVLGANTALFGLVGCDHAAQTLRSLLENHEIDCSGIVESDNRQTSIKTRIIAERQQVVRLDRESKDEIDYEITEKVLEHIKKRYARPDAIILGDYGKGFVTQTLVDSLRDYCRKNGIWLSLDPKPVHRLNIQGLSLVTPNRKEAFELAGMQDKGKKPDPMLDTDLLLVAEKLLNTLSPALLLITLGEQGMLLCQRNGKPFHIPTVAKEVFDVSGAGDTVIAAFTLAITAGASPVEAAIFSNHAAGIVVGKFGTAAVKPEELIESFRDSQ